MDVNLTATGVAAALSVPEKNVLGLRPKVLLPQHLDFMGLVRAGEQHQLVPEAVVLHEGQPFIYVLDCRQALGISEKDLHQGMRFLGLRADAPYVALVRPGVVQVFALAGIREDRPPILEASELEPGILARLIAGSIKARKSNGPDCGAHELMLALLNAVTDHLVHVRNVLPSEALALVGRALFMRFLSDREIVPAVKPLAGVGHVHECFASPESAAATCRWLDTTFNGDLLELPDHGSIEYFQGLNSDSRGTALSDLTAIMRGDRPVGDGAYQTQFSWGDLHFSYLPVGLLSQVYEEFAHRFDGQAAKGDSVYYTPRHLAEYLVDHSFTLLGPNAHKARILDPASGGGVFLLSAFRRLVKARWQATGEKPKTPVIRDILNNQIVGFDINPAARQLSALALYLTALELDSDAEKLENLVFTPLQDRVLIAAEAWNEQSPELGLGSLSDAAIENYGGQFDLVIGNPPWTAVSNAARRDALSSLVAKHMIHRGLKPAINPDGVPDLPFVWASTRLAKPDAVLAFALHGRLLTKISHVGHIARTRLFQGVEVSYVLNGMELRNTLVWPNMSAHFCLLLAHNRRAQERSEFFAVTPVEDRSLNREGRVRIDSKDAWTSDIGMVEKTPHLFKTLAKGNALDVELLERVDALNFKSIDQYLKNIRVPASHGYQTRQAGTVGMDADFLIGMHNMPKPQLATWYVAPVENLPVLDLERVHRRRERENYEAPLVLLRESPSSRPDCPMAILALSDVAYNRSFIGYSCKGTPNPELLAVYLSSIFNSSLFLYFTLMTSSKIGCERSTLQKAEAEIFPIFPLEEFSDELRSQLIDIKAGFEENSPYVKNKIDNFIKKLYRLRAADVNLIHDRLALALPFNDIRNNAVKPVDKAGSETYVKALYSALQPFDMSATELVIEALPQSSISPWSFLRLGGSDKSESLSATDMMVSIACGDMLDASLVEIPYEGSLYIGILNQRRYWSKTSARTLALDLIKRGHPVLSRGFQ